MIRQPSGGVDAVEGDSPFPQSPGLEHERVRTARPRRSILECAACTVAFPRGLGERVTEPDYQFLPVALPGQGHVSARPAAQSTYYGDANGDGEDDATTQSHLGTTMAHKHRRTAISLALAVRRTESPQGVRAQPCLARLSFHRPVFPLPGISHLNTQVRVRF
jgi:hypothetical protein